MKIVLILVVAGALAGCEKMDSHWEPELVRLAVASPERSEPVRSIECRPLDPSIPAEAETATSIEVIRNGGSETLSAALMASEARKNARLLQAVESYQNCRRLAGGHNGR